MYLLKKLFIINLLILSTYSAFAETNKSNASASCDSTCMTNATQSSEMSGLQQRVVACISGFTGTKLQTRVKNQNGTWSEWVDKNIDNCTCAPTSKTQSVICEEPLKGTIIEKSNWTCTTPKSGVWSNWTTESNNCYTPCKELPDESRTVSCPVNFEGSRTQTRSSICSGDDKLPPTWSAWTITSSGCVYSPPVKKTCSANPTRRSFSCMGLIWGAIQYGDSTGAHCSYTGDSGVMYTNFGSCNGGINYEIVPYTCVCN